MDYSILPHNANFIPPVEKPHPEFLKELGEQGIRDLLDRFYAKLYVSPIKHLFPKDQAEMVKAGQISADFFIQICGGPHYFNQRRGAPQMRGRHAPFAINAEARLHWLVCFEEVLQPLEGQISEASLQSFWNYINVFSIMMINTQG